MALYKKKAYLVETITDADYEDYIALHENAPTRAEYLF